MFDIKFISIKAVQAVSMSEKQYNSIQSIINWKKKVPSMSFTSNCLPSSLLWILW